MDLQEVRLECLKLSVTCRAGNENVAGIVTRANSFADFVLSSNKSTSRVALDESKGSETKPVEAGQKKTAEKGQARSR